MKSNQSGFTLVEIAIVLVIIGLLLGGILKGQELINSARVRNLADTTSGIQAAYFGFIDRYRHVPGDWNGTAAGLALGVTVAQGGNDNGRIDSAAADYDENNGLWEQLSKSGFIQGAFAGGNDGDIPDTNNNLAPLNAYNNVVIIGRTSEYNGTNPVRLNLVVGRGVPVNIVRELDVKLDDGIPNTGVLRNTFVDANVTIFTNGANPPWGGMVANCIDATPIWNVTADQQDCNAAYLY